MPSGAHGREPCLPNPPLHAAPILGEGTINIHRGVSLVSCGCIRGSLWGFSAIAFGWEDPLRLRALWGPSALEAEAAWPSCAFRICLIVSHRVSASLLLPHFYPLPHLCPPFPDGQVTLISVVDNWFLWKVPLVVLGFRLYCPGPYLHSLPSFFITIHRYSPHRLGLFILVPHPSLTYALTLPRGVFKVCPCPV